MSLTNSFSKLSYRPFQTFYDEKLSSIYHCKKVYKANQIPSATDISSTAPKNLTITSAHFLISYCEWKFYYYIYLYLLSVLTDIISVTLLYCDCDLRVHQSRRQFPFFHPPLRSLGLYVCGWVRTNTYLFCSSKIVYEKPVWTLREFEGILRILTKGVFSVWGGLCGVCLVGFFKEIKAPSSHSEEISTTPLPGIIYSSHKHKSRPYPPGTEGTCLKTLAFILNPRSNYWAQGQLMPWQWVS